MGLDHVYGGQRVGTSGHTVSALSVCDFDKYQRYIPRAGVATTGWSRENEATARATIFACCNCAMT